MTPREGWLVELPVRVDGGRLASTFVPWPDDVNAEAILAAYRTFVAAFRAQREVAQ